MPDYVRQALNQRGLMDAYHSRPPYQQNDHLGTLCVSRARLAATKQKRLNQMLIELEGRKFYLKGIPVVYKLVPDNLDERLVLKLSWMTL